MDLGLQYGLSGNQATYILLQCRTLKGNRFAGDGIADLRESLLDLSRKLYHFHCPIPFLFVQGAITKNVKHKKEF